MTISTEKKSHDVRRRGPAHHQPRKGRPSSALPLALLLLGLGSSNVASGLSSLLGGGGGDEGGLRRRTADPPSSLPPPPVVDVYLRLSPLVGGPRFLPLHAEVMLLDAEDDGYCFGRRDDDDDDDENLSGNDDASDRRRGRSVSGDRRRGGGGAVLHRFDFLPRDPTDPSTLARLLSLRSVPGVARYRALPPRTTTDGDDGGDFADGEEDDGGDRDDDATAAASEAPGARGAVERILRGGKHGLTFRLGSLAASPPPSSRGGGSAASRDDGDDDDDAYGPRDDDRRTTAAVLSAAVRFTERYQEERGDLRLVDGGCYNFALELLSHLFDGSSGSEGEAGISSSERSC